MSIRIRAAAAALAVGGLGLGLIGSGVHAAFTSSGTATENISVGTLSIQMSSTTEGAIVNPDSVTLTTPTISSSSPGDAPLEFTVTNTGTMPALVTITAVGPGTSPFTDMLDAAAVQSIPVGGHLDYHGGVQWTMLSNQDLGTSRYVTYTVTATA
jgi:predicted ribosomally synthesized peptide with SipW-like signal peptide